MSLLDAVGWALIHFLWQGTLVAGLAAGALAATRGSAATVRYAIGVAALATMAALPIATAWRATDADPFRLQIGTETPIALRAALATAATRGDVPTAVAGPTRSASLLERRRDATGARLDAVVPVQPRSGVDVVTWFPWLVATWAVGVLVLSVRLLGGWLRARRLSHDGVMPAPAACVAAAARFASRLGLRQAVRVLESRLLEAPVAIGWLRPVILLPTSALTGLPPEQLDAIIAHELAHIRRQDYLVNLAQSVVETVLFYHPAVWWVSGRIREEREHCCDDLAVAACGDRERYARALVSLEGLRGAAVLPVVRANGGSLIMRIKRLLTPELSRVEPTPRWTASVIACATVLTVGLSAGVPAIGGAGPAAGERRQNAPAKRTAPPAPPTVIRSEDTAAPLRERWARAEQTAAGKAWPRYWIGYSVAPPAALHPFIYSDHAAAVLGEHVRLSGTMTGDLHQLRFPGVSIDALIGGGDPRRVKLLFSLDATRGHRPAVTGTHASSIQLPVELDGRPLLWLGEATAAQSVPLVQRVYDGAPDATTKRHLVTTLALHDDSDMAASALIRILAGSEPADIRVQAAERLAWHPVAASLAALERAARSDREPAVRREAAESVADLDMAEATPTLIALAKTLEDHEARREAVEGLGQRPESAARDALVEIVRTDRDRDIQLEAVEALGELKDGAGAQAVTDIARTHPVAEIRREAIETLGDVLKGEQAVSVLVRAAREDVDVDVQREAVETLGEVEDARALPALVDLTRTHPRTEVRREAIRKPGRDRRRGRAGDHRGVGGHPSDRGAAPRSHRDIGGTCANRDRPGRAAEDHRHRCRRTGAAGSDRSAHRTG